MRNAERARSRIKDFSKRKDATNYIIPKTADYTMEALVQRLVAGESLRSINQELKNVTAARIRSGVPLSVETLSGYRLSPSERRDLTKAISEANKNIRTARDKFSDFVDMFPGEFSLKDIQSDLVNKVSVQNKIKDLGLFTAENLIPVSINETGEAGILAEKLYYEAIIERENERRKKVREESDPRTNKGFFLQQADVDTREIDISQIQDMEALKKRAVTWDDPARVYRSNLYLTNYLQALAQFETVLITGGIYNDTVGMRLDYIREVINKLYFNEEAIAYLSKYMPNIDIALISGGPTGDVDFSAIYDAWTEIEDMFL